MEKFIRKIILLMITSSISAVIFMVIMTNTDTNITGLAVEVFYALDKAGRNSGLPAVYLGDSVCNQVFPQTENSDEAAYIGCNNAITPCGTWLLLKEYLEHNPQTKEAYYIITPGSLGNNMHINHTYQYFVIPFINGETLKIIAPESRELLYHRFGRFFVNNRYVKNFLLNNNYFMEKYLQYIKDKDTPERPTGLRLSRASVIYLNEMRKLCEENGVKLHVRPLPMADVPGRHVWGDFDSEIKSNGFEDIFEDFTDRITYYPEDWFRDGVHFKKEILEQHLEEIRASALK